MRLSPRSAALVCAVAAFALIGAVAFERRLIATSADPGPANFPALHRLDSRDDALICPKSVCVSAKPDLMPPIFTVSAARLRQKLLAYARGAPGAGEIHTKQGSAQLRFVQRSSPFGAALFIDVLVIARSSEAATLAMYARGAAGSPLAHASDLARLRIWLDAMSN